MRRRFGFGAPIAVTAALAMATGLGFVGCNDTSSTTTVSTPPGPASTPAAVPAANPGAPDGPPHDGGNGWGGDGGNSWPCGSCESGNPNQVFVGWQFTLVIVNVQVFNSCTNDVDHPDNGSGDGQTTYLTDDGPAHFDSAPTDIEWCTLSYQEGGDQWQAGQQFQFDVSSESAQQGDDSSSDTVTNVDFSADADAGGVPMTIECHFPEQLPAGTLPVTKVNQLLGKAAQVSNPAPSPSPSPSPSQES